jgi:hypothetical protein
MGGTKNAIKIPYEECHKEINGILYKMCNTCREWKPCTDKCFYKQKNKGDGLHARCIKCEKENANMKEKYRGFTIEVIFEELSSTYADFHFKITRDSDRWVLDDYIDSSDRDITYAMDWARTTIDEYYNYSNEN